MSDHIYKQIELTGSSTDGLDAAIKNAVSKAAETVRNMHWFSVTEIRGAVEKDKVTQWQVSLKVGFRLE